VDRSVRGLRVTTAGEQRDDREERERSGGEEIEFGWHRNLWLLEAPNIRNVSAGWNDISTQPRSMMCKL
jgi:hypothetical protein